MTQAGVWDLTDLQSRYERAQLLSNDCTQDFAGNYFFPSDRSPKGYWTVVRKQRLDYACDCPDFARKIEQQVENFASSRWVRGDWSVNPDNRQLVNRCIHCFAVAIAEQELDPSFPINRIYQAKRERYPKTDCGCGCGGSGDCGCPNKVLGLPENRLIQGCETDCYVEPLTPRTQRTPSTAEGIPAYQTFEIPTIEFAQTRYQGCLGDAITITLRRNTSLGYNNATVLGLPTNLEFLFEPEFRTSSKQVTLDFYGPGIYTIGIGAIAAGNFGDLLEAQIEILDCGTDFENIDCPPQGFVDFDGYCEGSYFVAFRQTGAKNPDGSCEILKVLKFEEGLDCPEPESPLGKECESTTPANCTPTPLSPPVCVNGSGFNAVVKVLTGGKRTEYANSSGRECIEKCNESEIPINFPSCPEPPRKPPSAPTCGYAKRYLGWEKYDPSTGLYSGSGSSVGTAIGETFSCSDGTTYGLRGYTASCVPPSNRVLDDFAAANYQGNEFGEGCCPFDETKPPRPACSPTPSATKYSCSGGVCSLDPNGNYSSLAACQASLIPPSILGGQCSGVAYIIRLGYDVYRDGIFLYNVAGQDYMRSGKVVSVGAPISTGSSVDVLLTWTGGSINVNLVGGLPTLSVQNFTAVTVGTPNNCGDPPSSCP